MKSQKFSSLKRVAVTAVALSMLLGGAAAASAQTATSTLVAQIQSLMAQIKTLQAQLEVINAQKKTVTSDIRQALQLTRELSRGMTSEEVTTLQEILAADPEVYPEKMITGFFGPLTENAVKRFQKKHGIEQLGIVGPKTRTALQAYLGSFSTSTGAALPPGLAKKLWGVASTTLPVSTEGTMTICHYPPGNAAAKQTITIGVSAWFAHQKHGDTIGACSGETPAPATTTPDTVAPIISGLTASTTVSNSAVISWSTNENAKSKLWYGTTTPIDTTLALMLENENLKTSHAINITGLASSTVYYYMVASSDAAGNTATSSQLSFTTP